MANTIVQTGTTFRIFGDAVTTHSVLPTGTYRVHYSENTGHSLSAASDLVTGEEVIYGNHAQRIDRILKTYDRFDGQRSLGVLLSGDKGMGKSLMLRMLAHAVLTQRGMPVIIVDESSPGIATFLDTLGPCMVIFDEFEKIFIHDRHDDEQSQFLGLFDGASSVSRIYAVGINEVNNVSDYVINRPGRFHYHIRFDYPDADQITQYLADKAPELDEDQIVKIIRFASKVSLNYDHLRAIAFEMTLNGDDDFDEIISDLNIKNVEGSDYLISAIYSDGTVLVGEDSFNVLRSVKDSTYVRGTGVSTESGYIHYVPADARPSAEFGVLIIDGEKVRTEVDFDSDVDPQLVRLELRRQNQTGIDF